MNLNPLVPRTDEERIEDLEAALLQAQQELSRLYQEFDRLHNLIAVQSDTIRNLCKYIVADTEE